MPFLVYLAADVVAAAAVAAAIAQRIILVVAAAEQQDQDDDPPNVTTGITVAHAHKNTSEQNFFERFTAHSMLFRRRKKVRPVFL